MASPNPMQRRMVTCDEARPTKEQHTKPCADCPFGRNSIPGWLGSYDALTWIRLVMDETLVDCHCTTNQQCAGTAIFRANVAKTCRHPMFLRLPKDSKLVFSNPQEFIKHHGTKIKPKSE